MSRLRASAAAVVLASLIACGQPSRTRTALADHLATLDDAYRGQRAAGAQIAGIPLDGYTNHCAVRLADERTVVILIGMNTSGVVVYDRAGALSYAKRLPEIVAWQVIGADPGSTPALLLDQRDDHGTEIEMRNFHLYAIGAKSLDERWSGVSVAHAEERIVKDGFVRVEERTVFHVVYDRVAGTSEESSYELR